MENPLLRLLSCYSDNLNAHILEEPKFLPCQNKICTKCIQAHLIDGIFKCPFDDCKDEHLAENVETFEDDRQTQTTFENSETCLGKTFIDEINDKRKVFQSKKNL